MPVDSATSFCDTAISERISSRVAAAGLTVFWIIMVFQMLVVIDDFDVVRFAVVKFKANSPLAVDANGVLAFAVSGEGFEVIGGGKEKVFKGLGGVDLIELDHGAVDDV